MRSTFSMRRNRFISGEVVATRLRRGFDNLRHWCSRNTVGERGKTHDVSCGTGSRVAYAGNECGAEFVTFAQWVGAPNVFRTPYIEGAFDSLTRFVVAQKDANVATHYAKCMSAGKMTGDQLAENVRKFASRRPELHAGTVQAALVSYLNSMCGKPRSKSRVAE